jgi:profilin
MQVQPAEMKVIADILSGTSGAAAAKDKAFGDGLYIAGDRYVMTRAEERTIYARKV